jgi:outer membrane protein assembly factor BamB
MNIKQHLSLFICVITVMLFSCDKNDVTGTLGGQLTPFSVKVVERIPNKAIIEWTESVNIISSTDTVKYSVFINGRMVNTALVRLKDTIKNLSGDTVYNGKVLAYTKNGDTISAPFVLEKSNGYVFINDGINLKAIDFFSGSAIYTKAGFGGLLTMSNDTIFSAINGGGGLSALKVKTGEVIWNQSYPSLDGLTTSVTYHKGKLYGIFNNGAVQTWGYSLKAINSSNGQILWTSLNPGTSAGFKSIPVIENDRIFVGGNTQDFFALDLITGNILWKYQYVGQSCVRPLLTNNLVIITAGTKIFALNQSSGTLVWTRNIPYVNISYVNPPSPIIYNNIVIFQSAENGCFGLNVLNGNILWNYYDGLDYGFSFAIGDSKVYFGNQSSGNSNTKITALNATSGQLVWQVDKNGASNFLFVNNQLLASTKQLYSYIEVANSSDGKFVRTLLNTNSYNYCVRFNDINYHHVEHGNFK